LLGEEIMNIQSRLKEAQIALSESMEGKVPMQFEINKLSRERDSLQGRLKLLEDEVSSKTQQLVALNAHLTSSNTNFETRLNNESNNNKELSIRITSLQGIYCYYYDYHLLIIIIIIIIIIIAYHYYY